MRLMLLEWIHRMVMLRQEVKLVALTRVIRLLCRKMRWLWMGISVGIAVSPCCWQLMVILGSL